MPADFLEIHPCQHPVTGTIRPPGSKSLTNRALIVAALADGISHLTGALDSVDTRVMVNCLQKLGISIDANFNTGRIRVIGASGKIGTASEDLWCENSGTSIRFLTALCATGHGTYRLDGNERMRERPIRPLVDALTNAGIASRCELNNECPPVQVDTNGLPGGTITVAGSISSQYLSGLLMVAPAAQHDLKVEVTGPLVSRPYIDMTLEVMKSFGAVISEPHENVFHIRATGYRPLDYDIEPDASAASYFFAVAAITGGEVTVEGLSKSSLQGDVGFVDALVKMGCEATWGERSITIKGKSLQGIEIDMNTISDTAQTLACVAPFAAGPTHIRNVAHNRIKETDRITAVVTELRKTGLHVEEHPDGMTIHPGPPGPALIDTYDDHRMAMSFALLGLRAKGIRIADPGCTSKTYPNYFEDLQALCGAKL